VSPAVISPMSPLFAALLPLRRCLVLVAFLLREERAGGEGYECSQNQYQKLIFHFGLLSGMIAGGLDANFVAKLTNLNL
jgi:hypothetical protein